MKGASVKKVILRFFSGNDPICHSQKFQPEQTPHSHFLPISPRFLTNIRCRYFSLNIWVGQGVRSRSCLSAERRHFSSPRKKHFYFTKSFPNGIIGCVERGFYKKITRSPVSGDQVIRCCSDLMFPPKRDFILKKSLFLDCVHVQMINLFIKKFTHYEWRLYLGVADISFQLESEKNYHNYN